MYVCLYIINMYTHVYIHIYIYMYYIHIIHIYTYIIFVPRHVLAPRTEGVARPPPLPESGRPRRGLRSPPEP